MEQKLYGFVGKIARINLTTQAVSYVETAQYVPKYLGGRGICTKIFWDEVGPGVKAFDPENKIIYMTGATTGTGIPTGGRTVFGSISPNSLPEQYAWSGIGGWFGSELKFAGFDGFILEGRAAQPIYLYIEDGTIEFRSAEPLWGMLVHATQAKLEEIHGHEVKSIVIGPAGENLVRNASITSSNDNVAAKAGFGAVFGSKNLKAVSVRGTGKIFVYDIQKTLELRRRMGKPQGTLNPVKESNKFDLGPNMDLDVPQGLKKAQVACSYGCNQHCNAVFLDVPYAFDQKEKVNQVEKCVSPWAFKMTTDCGWTPIQTFATPQNNNPACMMLSGIAPQLDFSDPHIDELLNYQPGNQVDLWEGDYDRGCMIMGLCNEYGLDKWDAVVWLMTWLSMAKKMGVLDDLDFGMEPDVENFAFMHHLLDMIVYRKGHLGNLFAEGMARAIRALGKEKYGDTIYTGCISRCVPGKQLDIPISLESAWGHCYHWAGRGFQAAIDQTAWLPIALELMTSTRDAQTVTHHKETWDYVLEVRDDPCHSPRVAASAVMNENKAEIKDSVTSCDWQSPNVYWTDMECEVYEAATGFHLTEEEMMAAGSRLKNLFRAILIRNYGRDRALEADQVQRMLQFPDPRGVTVSKEDWNCLVDLYYDARGWDRKTGWPTRETWEKWDLKDVADELEAIGKLPE